MLLTAYLCQLPSLLVQKYKFPSPENGECVFNSFTGIIVPWGNFGVAMNKEKQL